MKIAITGNTYPVKDQLKALGATWDADRKAWMVPQDKAEMARQIVAQAPAKTVGATRSYTPNRCRDCGCTSSRYNRIYRNGQCRNCWLGDKEEADMGY